jgi:hypothetical protein
MFDRLRHIKKTLHRDGGTEVSKLNCRSSLAEKIYPLMPAGFRQRRSGTIRVPKPAAISKIIPSATPRWDKPPTQSESYILDLLQGKEEISYSDVVEGLAEFLYQKERATGSAIVDIGVWGEAVFVSEAQRELELGKGKIWEFDFAGRKPDELLSHLSRYGATTLPGDRRGRGRRAQDRQPIGGRRGGDGA